MIKKNLIFTDIPTGKICIAEKSGLITNIHFHCEKIDYEYTNKETTILKEAKQQITEYFAGKRKQFKLPLDISGSEFVRKVLNELIKISFGDTICYSDLAGKSGYQGAARAVGSVCNRNKIPIVIPCHRVIGKNGSLTGFSGGNDVKSYLLDFEKRIMNLNNVNIPV